jgi:hypothetical protein
LKLFQSMFGGREAAGRYPESLIEMAIERAVDGTDPRLRLVPGYRKRLRAPVIHAIDHVIALVDGFPEPVPAGPDGYRDDVRLAALFASIQDMLRVLGRDRALTDYLAGAEGQGAPTVGALLLAQREERNILGMALAGDQVRREVAQVSVSFSGHRLLEPRISAEESGRFLKRRAFDHVLVLALGQITEAGMQRADLKRQRDLLQRKLTAMQRGSLGLDAPEAGIAEHAALQAEHDAVSEQLQALGADAGVLKAHLEIVAERLGSAERQIWKDEVELCLSPMNIRLDPADASARRMVFQELETARGARATLLPVVIATRDLPAREDLVAAAARYL